MKAVAAGAMVSARNITLLASAPQAWARHQEQTLIREREASEWANSEWIGTAPDSKTKTRGSRLELEVEIKSIRYIHGDYGVRTLYTMATPEGNLVKWFASGIDVLGEDTGARYRIRGTVKAHETFKGIKSTLLTRCQVLDELEPAGE